MPELSPRRSPDPILGPPSLSVGRIEGGQSVNIVPDWCEIEIDRRVIPGEDPNVVPKMAEAFLTERLGRLEDVEFLPPWVRMPALAPSVPAEWLDQIREAIAATIGRKPEVTGVPYGTDAGPLGQTGLACLVLGPGDIAQAHTKDEWIDLAEAEAGAEVYFQIACASDDQKEQRREHGPALNAEVVLTPSRETERKVLSERPGVDQKTSRAKWLP